VAGDSDVWLKKRLVESVGSQPVPRDRLIAEMTEAAVASSRAPGVTGGGSGSGGGGGNGSGSGPVMWEYLAVAVPWQRQIGPSCGLAALRMVRDFFVGNSGGDRAGGVAGADSRSGVHKQPSLLQAARDAGCSTDGEVFDAAALQKLAETVCGLRCEMRSFAATTPTDIVSVLSNGGCFIVPYDAHPGTRLPSHNGGRSAHYGVIIGAMFPSRRGDSERPSAVDTATSEASGDTVGTAESSSAEGDAPQDAEVALTEHRGGRVPSSSDDVLAVVLHSMSHRLCIAPLSAFAASNAQLASVDESRFTTVDVNLADRLVACVGLADE